MNEKTRAALNLCECLEPTCNKDWQFFEAVISTGESDLTGREVPEERRPIAFAVSFFDWTEESFQNAVCLLPCVDPKLSHSQFPFYFNQRFFPSPQWRQKTELAGFSLMLCRITHLFIEDLWNTLRCLDEDDPRYKTLFDAVQDPNSKFLRISGDRFVQYGDGGQSLLAYPVWSCRNGSESAFFIAMGNLECNSRLVLSEEQRRKLLRSIVKIDEIRKDRHGIHDIVHDVVDPNLGARLITREEHFKLLRKEDHLHDEKCLKRSIRGLNDRRVDICVDLGTRMRSQLCWIPTDAHVTDGGAVEFLTKIHNLPTKSSAPVMNERLENLLTAFQPALYEHMGLLARCSNFQFSLQIQRYQIPPWSTYAGKWHTEGISEHVVAVAVYYVDIDQGLQGGNLKFRPRETPEKWYNFECDREVEVGTGLGVIFSNDLPHRCRMITNETDEPLFRTFITFFFIDPLRPLPNPLQQTMELTEFALRYYNQQHALRQLSRRQPVFPLGKLVEDKIIELVSCQWKSLEEAKEYRRKMREAMDKTRSGWGNMHYGNCGGMRTSALDVLVCNFVFNEIYQQNSIFETIIFSYHTLVSHFLGPHNVFEDDFDSIEPTTDSDKNWE